MKVQPINPNLPGYDVWHALGDRWLAAGSVTAGLHAQARREGHDQPGVLCIHATADELKRSMAGEKLAFDTEWITPERFAADMSASLGCGVEQLAEATETIRRMDPMREMYLWMGTATAPIYSRIVRVPIALDVVH